MTSAVAGGPTTPRPAPSDGSSRRRSALEAIQESRRALVLAGVLLALVTATIVYLIVAAFTGRFTRVVNVKAELPQGSNAVPVSAPVEYRYVTVGKVGRETQAPDGSVAVDFEIYPRFLAVIPRGVQAQVAPLSIFGNQYVNLVPPATDTTGHLEASDFVGPYVGAPSSSLQGTTTQLYNLLHAVHPADLDTALTAFAEGLNGEGRSLGQTLAGSSDYLGQAVAPNLSNVIADTRLLDPVTNEVKAATPDLLGLLSNASVTGRSITEQQSYLHTLLTSGTSAAGRYAGVLQQVQASLPELLNESAPLLNDITANPQKLAQTLSGLTQFAGAVANAESKGPFLSVTANLPVTDISAGVNAALGYENPASVDAALGNLVNPSTYTAANCPQYPGETNPYCGTGGSPDAAPVSASSASSATPTAPSPSANAGSSSTYGYSQADTATEAVPGELQAIDTVAAALNDGHPPASPGFATIVLLPLLSSVTGRS